MGTTALSSFHTTTTSTRGKAIEYRKAVSRADVPVEIRTIPFVHSISAAAEDVEVLPAERSELASRITNVVIAAIALAALLRNNLEYIPHRSK